MRDDGAIGRWARRESEIRKQVVERLITILLLGIYLGAAIAGIVKKMPRTAPYERVSILSGCKRSSTPRSRLWQRSMWHW